jgi:predicted lipoprotein with Yx(FWY)xxD motif
MVATLTTRTTSLGKILVNSRGRTLYLFERDNGGRSACYSQCAKFWPPLLTAGKLQAAASLSGGTAPGVQRRSSPPVWGVRPGSRSRADM